MPKDMPRAEPEGRLMASVTMRLTPQGPGRGWERTEQVEVETLKSLDTTVEVEMDGRKGLLDLVVEFDPPVKVVKAIL